MHGLELDNISRKAFPEGATQLLIDLFDGVSDPVVKLLIAKKLALSPQRDIVIAFLFAKYLEDVSKDCIGYDSYRWGLASLIESLASQRTKDVPRFLGVVRDRAEFGSSRQMLVLALAKMANLEIDRYLLELLSDDQVNGHAVIALGKRRVLRAAPLLRNFLEDERAWVRKEAAKAIKRIDGT